MNLPKRTQETRDTRCQSHETSHDNHLIRRSRHYTLQYYTAHCYNNTMNFVTVATRRAFTQKVVVSTFVNLSDCSLPLELIDFLILTY